MGRDPKLGYQAIWMGRLGSMSFSITIIINIIIILNNLLFWSCFFYKQDDFFLNMLKS